MKLLKSILGGGNNLYYTVIEQFKQNQDRWFQTLRYFCRPCIHEIIFSVSLVGVCLFIVLFLCLCSFVFGYTSRLLLHSFFVLKQRFQMRQTFVVLFLCFEAEISNASGICYFVLFLCLEAEITNASGIRHQVFTGKQQLQPLSTTIDSLISPFFSSNFL